MPGGGSEPLKDHNRSNVTVASTLLLRVECDQADSFLLVSLVYRPLHSMDCPSPVQCWRPGKLSGKAVSLSVTGQWSGGDVVKRDDVGFVGCVTVSTTLSRGREVVGPRRRQELMILSLIHI